MAKKKTVWQKGKSPREIKAKAKIQSSLDRERARNAEPTEEEVALELKTVAIRDLLTS
jgi:hypothetical protein